MASNKAFDLISKELEIERDLTNVLGPDVATCLIEPAAFPKSKQSLLSS